jgi:hypothetical protein
MKNILTLFMLLFIILPLSANSQSQASDKAATCILGKLAEQEKQNLKRSDCIKYCLKAYGDSKIEYLEDGTAQKTICEWNQKDILVLGGFHENSTTPAAKSERLPASSSEKSNVTQEAPKSPQENRTHLQVPRFDYGKTQAKEGQKK